MNKTVSDTIFYFNPEESLAAFHFSKTLSSLLSKYCDPDRQLIFLCIGSDRVTGDSLGPLIGYKLAKKSQTQYKIYGTLKSPVHALNLQETLSQIYKKYNNPFVVAIDASLGTHKHLGLITLGKGSITPGAGVQKDLPRVGDLFITGIVNVSGVLDTILLQTTRLSIVMSMVDCITLGIGLINRNSHFSWLIQKERDA